MCECKNQSPFLLQAECYVEEDNHSSTSKQSQRNKNISHHKTNNFSPKTKNSIIPNSKSSTIPPIILSLPDLTTTPS